jgi:RHS repeat-associated protein
VVFKRLLDERLAFTGHERDDDGTTSDEADFDDMHARYFSPGIARFLSIDPDCCSMDQPQSWNRYAYVLNNPVNMADPSGRWPQWFDDARTAWTRVTQGVFLHAGATAVQDAAVRQNYLQAAAKLAPTDSAGRTALKVAAREQSSPLGAALAERMRPAAKEAARVGGTASKTNAGVNEGLAAAGRVGKVALVAGVAISVARVAAAEEGERPKVAAEEGGAWAGALAFGAAGAKGGAVVGSFFGPGPGTAIGAAIGGIGGGIFGSFAGAQAADNVYDLFSGD